MNKQEQKIKELENKISKLKSAVAELRVLNEIAITSSKASDIDQILNLIVQKAVKAIEAEQGSILLVTKNKNKQFKTFVRQDDTSRLKHNYHIGANIIGFVLNNKKPLIIEDLSNDERFNPTEEEKRDINSVLCVPIWFEGDIIGLMMLINKKNKKHFSNSDITLFSIIAVQAGQLIKNMELQRKAFQDRKESEKLQELNRLKTNFFTNISHEFRTPLTLILGQAKQILENSEEGKINERVKVIFRNGTKLKKLTNQILDLSQIEAGQMKLRASSQNIVPVINSIVSSFQSLAEIKNISLEVQAQREKISLYFDRDKLEKIIGNLLSNALKFTPEGGNVNVKIQIDSNSKASGSSTKAKNNFITIIVTDTGIGISKEQINKIFNRFYQVNSETSNEYEGTGIGLSLAKELIELHKGEISVESTKGEGTTFKILLLLGNEHLLPNQIVKLNSNGDNEIDESVISFSSILQTEFKKDGTFDFDYISTGKNVKPELLIIEDNSDVRNYIKDILRNNYKITEASNGKKGLDKSFEDIPDLIISDIMMPELDGMELCRKLKTDNRTSHIPIILLTAKSASTDKIEGLEIGADDYIMKPFEASELQARIKNLLEQRKRIHEHFRQHGFLIDDDNVTAMDQEFLKKVVSIINKNLQDSEFTVKILAEEMTLSRSQFYKKLISLVGESPNDIIRRLRLNKAVKLIEQNAFNISEVAFEVGFNNPSYFAKCFQKQFGVSPSQYHKNPTNH